MRGPLAALFTALLLVAGCDAGTSPTIGPPTTTGPAPSSTGSPPARAPAVEPPSAGGSPTAVLPGTTGHFSATDIAWLQLSVAMAERLLPMLDLVPDRTADPAWRRLAIRIATSERAHLTRSRRLLADSGAPLANPHEGHDMPGMVTDADLTALRSATGQQFHHRLAGHLRAHLTQSVRIATAEQQAGTDPATTALAAAVVRVGTADLARLDHLDGPSASSPLPAPP
ncbi:MULTISPECIES: DUF305 domain-containing protein [unclassified Micromonospora]|uniref:DUF305 domain-containing protein n=1 Tax=unclassified Micromonospora TaxID=2617518 RepID=UPI0022B6E5D9|nr:MULTISPECIES: DUF305 domain-containing protein [unclassified Micromonospora]MCZ7422787.1 DUF305 domain-containing protein [Verrucosispora sp. WMMA2121]WBB90525.1 DUF305 domain-containing protein [Verrucosispora sp. WMMC514]